MQRLALSFPLVLILVALALFLQAGCAQLAPVRDNIVAGVRSYCEAFTPEQRALIRAQASEGLVRVCVKRPDGGAPICGATIRVHCPGDPPDGGADAAGAHAGN